MESFSISPDCDQAMADHSVHLRTRPGHRLAQKLKRVVRKIQIKRSLRSYEGYGETAEYEKFARICTHRHGSSQNNLPRSEEHLSETSSSSQQPKKPSKVHFVDEDIQHALAASNRMPMPPTEQMRGLMKRWLDPSDYAEPGTLFAHVCPVTYSYVEDIRKSGVKDWITRTAFLVALNDARIPMLEGSTKDDALMHDLQALQVLYCIVEGMGVYGVPSW